MNKYQCRFKGRLKGAIGTSSTCYKTVEADDPEAARLKLHDTHEHIQMLTCARLVERYAITHVNKDGARVLTFGNQGRNHFDTREEAERKLDLFRAGLIENYRDMLVGTLAVRPFDCYEHGDAVGIYFHGPVYRKVNEMGGFVLTNRDGHEANFADKAMADKFEDWMGETGRACSTVCAGYKRYTVGYKSKLDHDHE